MAIFPGLPGVEVTILINGMAVWEYDDDDEVDFKPDELSQYQALKTISKYIESMTDEEFTIQVSSLEAECKASHLMECMS
jgi:hypothetical protein